MDKKKLCLAALKKLSQILDHNLTLERANIFYEVLSKELNDDKIIYACNYLENNFDTSYGQKFPVPKHFIEAVKGSLNDRLNAGWDTVLKTIKDYGYVSSINFNDLQLHYTIQQFGGWTKCCKWELSKLPFIEKEFKKIYETAIKSGREGRDYVIGWVDQTNYNDNFKTKIEPKQVYVQITTQYRLENKKDLRIDNIQAPNKKIENLVSNLASKKGF